MAGRIQRLLPICLLAMFLATAQAVAPAVVQPSPLGLWLVLSRDDRKSGDQRVAIIARDWLYCDPLRQQVHFVPSGYVTDFASVPGPARIFYPQFGEWAEAAVIHDYLYALQVPGAREEADRIFRQAMKEQGVGVLARNIMHAAVRLGGGRGYSRETEWSDSWGKIDEGAVAASPAPRKPQSSVVAKQVNCRDFEKSDVHQPILREATEQWRLLQSSPQAGLAANE